jgi:hypothetical protein
MYVLTWTDSKYGKRHTEEYEDILDLKQAMRELSKIDAKLVSIIKVVLVTEKETTNGNHSQE